MLLWWLHGMTEDAELDRPVSEVLNAGGLYRPAEQNLWRPVGSRRAFVAFTLALATFLGLTALALALGTQHLEHPMANALLRPALVVPPILVGLAWKLRRPESPFGVLLIILGVFCWTQAWQAANQPLVYSLGVLLGDIGVVLASFYLALAFPVGRLTTAGERLVMSLIVLAMGARVVWAFQTPVLQGGGTLSRCGDACPTNPLELAGPSWLGTLAFGVETFAIIAATVAFIVLFAHRLASAPRPRRRALITVGATSLVFFPMFLVYQTSRRLLELDPVTLESIQWVQVGLRIIFPIGFAVALVQADLFAGRVLHRFLEKLTFGPSAQQWRDTVAGALDDPTVRIGYWDPQSARFLEPNGDALEPSGDRNLTVVTVEHHAVPVAALEVDAILRTDPELLRAAANATLLAVERGILEDELRASQQATLDAGDLARRRIAQDLHDSAQQRLVALRMHLDNARRRLPQAEGRDLLERLSVNVDEALGDIRAVARGTHVEQLHREGLERALRAAVDGTLSVRFHIDDVPEISEEIEDSIYFVILEALQNVAKHAGSDVTVDVTVRRAGDHVVFTVADDGAGFDPRAMNGLGFDNMVFRLQVVGGQLDVDSEPGRGTTVTGRIALPGEGPGQASTASR
jgi:signal transduction histidine kinase